MAETHPCKPSRYNVLVDSVAGESVLFNTFSGRAISLNASRQKEYAQLCAHPSQKLATDFSIFLETLGFIVADDVDEVARVKDRYWTEVRNNTQASLTVSLTEACNLRCTYCYQAHARENYDSDVASSVRSVIQESIRAGARKIHINWFGGEPLLKLRQLGKLSEEANELCNAHAVKLSQHVTTNGVLLTPNIAEKLRGLGVRDVQITIDGASEHHNLSRPTKSGRSSYSSVLNGCRSALEADLKLILRINVTEDCGDDIDSLLDDIRTIGANKTNTTIHAVRAIDHSSETEEGNGYLKNAEFARIWVRILEKVKRKGFAIPHLNPLPYNCAFDNGRTFFIDYSGQVGGCSSVPTLPLVEKVSDIASGPRNPEYFESYCRNCTYLPTCMGGCQYLEERGREKCAPEKYVFKELIRLHYGLEEDKRCL